MNNNVYKSSKASVITLAFIFLVFSSKGQGAITKIDLPMWVKLDTYGHLSEAGAVELFRRAKGHGNRALGEPISAKKMTEEARFARFGTAQLFTVKCKDGNNYILKAIKQGAREEVERLERVRTSERLAPYIGPKEKDNLQINGSLAYVSYWHGGKEHILVIMREAEGISLQWLMQQFKKDPNSLYYQKIHAKAYYDLGAALAMFYRAFAHRSSFKRTLVHGDMHSGNIFYYEDGGDHLVTFIDNERMAKSLDRGGSISADLGCLFVTSPFVMEWSQSGFLKNFDAKKWYSIVIPSFVLGFIRKFPKKERADCFKTIKGFLLQWDSRVNRNESRHLRGLIKEQLLILEKQLVTEGKTALHIAACYPALSPVLKRMLFYEKTTAIGDKDKDGNIALHEAAYFGNIVNVLLLLDAGRSLVGKRNNNGETALFKAEYNRGSYPSRYDKVIKELKKAASK